MFLKLQPLVPQAAISGGLGYQRSQDYTEATPAPAGL